MPYSITNNNSDCSGWAVVDPDNKVFGCHTTKTSAIKQAVAISLATDEPFVGERAINQDAPEYMRAAAKQGLKYYEDGLAGDGLVGRTVTEARLMADGEVSDDKWIRIAAWIARHMPDLDAEDADPQSENYPSAGVVAHLLWGSGPSKEAAERTLAYAQSVVERIRAEETRKADGDPIIICDIDGTLLNGITLIQKTWDYVRSLEGALFIVTGRPESERESTAADLHNAGVTYSRLVMNPGSSADSVEYKKATAEALLETYNVVAAVENNPDALAAYRSLGIKAVNPATLPEGRRMAENRATPDELNTGDFVAWLVGTESYAGQVVSVDGETTIVRIWDEEEDIWEMGDLDVVVATEALQLIEPLQPMPESIDPMTAELNGSTIIPTRDKWIRAAWKIKAKLEGLEERALGKGEVRTNHIELRAEGDGRTFTGYASVFNEPSLPLPFTEIVKPGAFKRSLQSRNRIMLLWNHDTSNPLASTRNGSLQLVEDSRGLKVTATLPDTTLGRDLATLVKIGTIDAMSFGFSVKKDSWSQDGQTRYLEDVSLAEVSLVSTPAYEQTSGTVSVRSLDGISADVLADALLRIETGEELDAEQGQLITEVIGKLTKAPEVEEVEGDMVALYKKKLDLIEKGI